VGGNTAVLVGLGETVAGAGIAERAGVQGHGERKVVAGRQLVGIVNTVARVGAEVAGEPVVDAGVGRVVGDVGAAAVAVAAASRIGYHHNRSSRTERTAQQEDAVVVLAGEGSIASCKLRN